MRIKRISENIYLSISLHHYFYTENDLGKRVRLKKISHSNRILIKKSKLFIYKVLNIPTQKGENILARITE